MFDGAQKTLRAVFGMEMVELPVKEKLTKEEKRKGECLATCLALSTLLLFSYPVILLSKSLDSKPHSLRTKTKPSDPSQPPNPRTNPSPQAPTS